MKEETVLALQGLQARSFSGATAGQAQRIKLKTLHRIPPNLLDLERWGEPELGGQAGGIVLNDGGRAIMDMLSKISVDVSMAVVGIGQIQTTMRDAPRTLQTTINTLTPQPFNVRKPIPVTMEVTDEDTIASFLEANVSASGDTPQEAFHNLCDILIAKYKLFESLEPAKLGREPTRQLAVMREFINRE